MQWTKDMKRVTFLLFICLRKCDQADKGISKSSSRCTPPLKPIFVVLQVTVGLFSNRNPCSGLGKKLLPLLASLPYTAYTAQAVSCRDTYDTQLFLLHSDEPTLLRESALPAWGRGLLSCAALQTWPHESTAAWEPCIVLKVHQDCNRQLKGEMLLNSFSP